MQYVNVPHFAFLVGIKFRQGEFGLLTTAEWDYVSDFTEGYENFVRHELEYEGPIESPKDYFPWPEEWQHEYILYESDYHIVKLLDVSSLAGYMSKAINIEEKKIQKKIMDVMVKFGGDSDQENSQSEQTMKLNKAKTRSFSSESLNLNYMPTMNTRKTKETAMTYNRTTSLENIDPKSETKSKLPSNPISHEELNRYMELMDQYI